MTETPVQKVNVERHWHGRRRDGLPFALSTRRIGDADARPAT